MPSGYDVHDERIEVFLPLTIDPKTFPTSRGSHFLFLIGRLKSGVTAAAAQAHKDSEPAHQRHPRTRFGYSGQDHIVPISAIVADGKTLATDGKDCTIVE